MKSLNNLKLLKFSLSNPEPIIDDFYIKNGSLIISRDIKRPTEIMDKNVELLESISVYSFARKSKDKNLSKKLIKKILKIVKGKNINFSEFVSFWSVVDVSYSLFSKLDKESQLKVMSEIVDKYIDLRHNLYLTYGYSPTTLQVGKDAKAHKESGNLGINKVAYLLDKAGYKKIDSDSAEDFLSRGDKKYIEADKKGKKLFLEIIKKEGINFLWSSNKEKKMPDFLIKCKDKIFILEHKHMKEPGGGQDKQMNELISLIASKEINKKVGYVSFLDGRYFNLFTKEKTLAKGKVFNQLESIKKNLEKNSNNFFVNTAGFKEFLRNI